MQYSIVDMVHVLKNDARLRKPFRCCSAFLLLTRLGRHKRSSRRRKRSPGRSVSEAAPRFGNLCVLNPVLFGRSLPLLRKKPSIPGRSLPICGRSLPICGGSCAANAFRKSVPNVGIIFFDAYRSFQRNTAAQKLWSVCMEMGHESV